MRLEYKRNEGFFMMLETILKECDKRYEEPIDEQCVDCSYGDHCPHDCEKCLDFIHNPSHAPDGAPKRKYDCTHMADFYTCKYSCRYTSEIIYALERFKDLPTVKDLKVLSFGCGPCTDLFAIDYLHTQGVLPYETLEYRGVDYSENVWKYIHRDISNAADENSVIKFYYRDACELIHTIAQGHWVPNLIVFQYVFSDMEKHTSAQKIHEFIEIFAQYFNEKVAVDTYVVLNDINLGRGYGGGREYFDQLYRKLNSTEMRKGHFCNDNSKSSFYPRGYPYGDDSDGEFPQNTNRFNWRPWLKYSPFDTCASAQMLIKKVVKE